MGFLELEVDAKAYRLGTAVRCQFCASRDTFYGLPFWKVFPSRSYKLFVQSEEEIYE
jgi:ecdysone 20-monooxygenase